MLSDLYLVPAPPISRQLKAEESYMRAHFVGLRSANVCRLAAKFRILNKLFNF